MVREPGASHLNPVSRAGTIAYVLWRLSRPSQVALIGLVYALGIAVASGHGFDVTHRSILIGVLGLLPVAVSVHYANEFADYETDALTTRTPFSGGSGALIDTGLPRRFALVAAVAAGILAVFSLVVLSRTLSPTAVALLTVIVIAGWQYSVGPFRLAWRGLGEVTNAALGGVLLPLYGYAVVTGTVTVEAALTTIPFVLVVFVNLLETTWPDRAADAAVGKRTLATRWSRTRLRAVYILGSLLAGLSVLALAGTVLPVRLSVLTLCAMGGLVWGSHRFTRRETPFPAVVTMVLVALVMTGGWFYEAGFGLSFLRSFI